MGPTLALSSSDGRFDLLVSSDEVELIASMLILLELPRETVEQNIRTLHAVPDHSHAA